MGGVAAMFGLGISKVRLPCAAADMGAVTATRPASRARTASFAKAVRKRIFPELNTFIGRLPVILVGRNK